MRHLGGFRVAENPRGIGKCYGVTYGNRGILPSRCFKYAERLAISYLVRPSSLRKNPFRPPNQPRKLLILCSAQTVFRGVRTLFPQPARAGQNSTLILD